MEQEDKLDNIWLCDGCIPICMNVKLYSSTGLNFN